MKVLLNLKNFFKYFIVIFFVSFLFYLVRMFGSYNIISDGGNMLDYLHLFIKLFSDCFFLFSILSSALAILLISTGAKLKGGLSVIISILIISVVCFVYPVCMKYLNYGQFYSFLLGDNMELYSNPLNKDYIDNKGSSFIYIASADDYEYKDTVILDNYDMITASYASGTGTNLNLVDVNILNLKDDSSVHHKNYSYRLATDAREDNARTLDIFFAMPLIDYFGMLFSFFINESIPLYVYAILFLSLFVLLIGFYMLGAALSAPFMRFQNMTISFVVYIMFILSLYFICGFVSSKAPIDVLPHTTGPLMISLLLLISSSIVNLLALLIHFIFRFDKYYK